MDSPAHETGRDAAGATGARHVREALERHEASLMAYAVSIAGDLEMARDAVQDTFLRLCEQPDGALDGHLLPWLFTVCRNRILDVRRKERRMTPLEAHEIEERPAQGPSPADDAASHDDARRARQLLAGLPANQREVVRLRFEHHLSYDEIARVTSLTATNVGFLLHTALRTLRTRMEASPLPRLGANP